MSGETLRVGIDASMLSEQRTGMGNYVFHLLRQLVADPQAVDFSFYLYSHRAIAADCQNLGVCTEQVGAWLRKGPLWLSLALPPLLARDRIDVFWGANGFLPLQTGRSWRTVVTIYDLVYHYAGHTMPWYSRWSRRLLQPLAVRGASAVTAISQATAAEVKLHYRREVDAVIPPGMDPRFQPVPAADVKAVRAQYPLPDRYWLSLGTLEPRKNLLAVLAAYAQVRLAQGAACPPLVLAGARGWLDGPLQARLKELTLQGHVYWLGFVPQNDMPALYAACEAFVFFPLYEGYGMPVREALLCGAPVLCSDLPALREAGESHARYAGTGVTDIALALHELARQPARTSPVDSAARLSRGLDDAARFSQVLHQAARKPDA